MKKTTLFLFSLFLSIGAMAKVEYNFEVIDIKSNADEMLYSNAPCTVTQYDDDFRGWHVLFDNNPETIFHSQYGSATSVDGLDHYLRVDMGEGNELTTFKFTFTTRNKNSNVNSPTTIVVEGSNEANGTYTEIKTITGISQQNSYKYESEVLGNASNAYRYIRFRVTATGSNQTDGGGKKFFFISEFGMSKAIPFEAPVIEDFYSANTTFGTYSGPISNIINGNKSDKWWSNGAQDIGKTITVTLNNVHQVGVIKWYFCDGDKPQGAAIERKATADGEWINIADFTINDIENNIFTCTAEGADVKELRLRITTAHTNWLQVAEVELWEYVVETDKTELQALIADAEDLLSKITEPRKIVGEKLNITGKISSNAAQNNADGNSGADNDGAGIAGLTDTNPETYFHSRWSGAAVDEDHYLQIDLGDGGKLSDFVFEYQTRKTNDANQTSPAPTAIEVSVSEDGSNFGNPIATFTKDANGLPAHTDLGQTLWRSDVIFATKDIRYIRLTVTDSKGPGDDTWNSHHFFAMGTLNIYPVNTIYGVKEEYSDLITDADYEAAVNALAAAKTKNESLGATQDQVNTAANELNTALEALRVDVVSSYTLNVSAVGWASLYLDFPAAIPNFGNEDEEAGVYIVTGVKDSGYLTLEKVASGVLPAETGVIIKAEQGTYDFTYSEEEQANVDGNLLQGTVTDDFIEGPAYVLGNANGIGFYQAVLNKNATGSTGTTHFKNNAYKSYLLASKISSTLSRSVGFRFNIAGTTAVEDVEIYNEKEEVYDLAGRKLESIAGVGIYIVNGRKVLVK